MGWLTGWTYRKDHFITPASGAGQNYQKRIVVHFGFGVDNDENVYLNGNCQADFGDLRFTDNTGVALLDYWIQKKVDGNYTICWVEVRDDLSVYDKKVYIYYDKPGSTSVANGDATFIFFDDFEVDLSRWNMFGGPTLSTDYAYTGIKSVKLPINSNMSHLQAPYDSISVHAHFYDRMLPLIEYTVVSIDAGELEVSMIGLMDDFNQYDYKLQGTVYNSGIDRTIGWHEFITRCSLGLKQFIIDGNIMPITGTGNWCPRTFIFAANISEVLSYWDTVFWTKFVNPEPAHGTWGIEETGTGIATFVAEDVENSISSAPLVLEETLLTLLGSLHILKSSEDMVYPLAQKPLDAEDTIASLLVKRRILTVEDLVLTLSGSLHAPVLSEDVIMALLAKRTLQGQDIIYERPLLYRTRLMAFPIFGGSHIIQVKGEEE